LAQADVFLLPSHYEGQSNAMAEAFLCGVPAVAYDVGGNREAIEAVDGGALVPYGAFVREFVNAIDAVSRRFTAPGERRALQERARHRFCDEAINSWMDLIGAAHATMLRQS